MRDGDFDLKFGAEFLASVPAGPGVYLVYDRQDELIYVGKANSLKRRLSQYRSTLRRKKYRRMLKIVKDAARIEVHCAGSAVEACLIETMLIQKHRPRWNIVGAFAFLYPLIGIRSVNGDLEFCMTTTPEAVVHERGAFEFHGAFRSRRITGDAFFSLMRLLKFVGHLNPGGRGRLPKYSYIFSFRKLPLSWAPAWSSFLKGESASAMEELILKLVENTGARCRSRQVQEHLDTLKRFWRHEVLRLYKVRQATGCLEWPVPQYQRDLIFLCYNAGVTLTDEHINSAASVLRR